MESPLKQRPLRNPGQSLDEQIQELQDGKLTDYLMFVVGFLLLAIMEWYGYLAHAPRRPWLFTLATVAATAIAAVRLAPIVRQIRQLKQGRDGERIVAEQLDVLKRDGSFVLHDVLGDGFNLDHVIVSTKGIFAVETKTLSKPQPKATVVFDGQSLTVDGARLSRNPIEQVRAQMTWLANLLKQSTGRTLPVRGVVVFPSWWTRQTGRARDSGIWVLEPKAVRGYLAHEPDRLSAEDASMACFHLQQYVRSKG
jgi:hypothetical protein